MKKLLIALVMLMSFAATNAKPLFPDSDTSKSEAELGVEGIQRLCPTNMWDYWIFRDIKFDRVSNTVVMIIQLNSWSEHNDEKIKEATESDILKQTEWIVSNFKEGYEDLKTNPRIIGDGDFMLFLSVGTLLKQMEKEETNLQIMLLKPDDNNRAFGDMPLKLSFMQLKKIMNEE